MVSITEFQREVLVGTMLGDAYVNLAPNKKGASLWIEQAGSHKEYVEHMYSLFESLKPGKLRNFRTGEYDQYEKYSFKTKTTPELLEYRDLFYSDRVKVVRPELRELITDVSLAYWYMDDGSIKSRESKGVIFNTQGFTRVEVNFLAEVLRDKFDLDCWERRQRGKTETQYQIYVSGYSYDRFIELVSPYIIESMWYKIPPARTMTGAKRFTEA